MAGRFSEELALLVDLDTLDQELLELRAEQRDVPKSIAVRQSELVRLTGVRDALGVSLDATKKITRDGERNLEAIERRVARATKRLEELFVSTQIEATEREIIQLGEQQDEAEVTVLESMELVDALTEQLTSATLAVAEAEALLDAAQAAWDARRPVVQARVATLEGEHAVVTGKITRETLRKYLVGFENRQNSRPRGITRTDGIMCTMCQLDVPVRWVNEARTGDGVHACLGCKRVIAGKVDDSASDIDD